MTHLQILGRGVCYTGVEALKKDNGECCVTLEVAGKGDLLGFKRDLQEAFAKAVTEAFGSIPDEMIPSDEDIEKSFSAPGAVTYHILSDGNKVAALYWLLMKQHITTRLISSIYLQRNMVVALDTRHGEQLRKGIPRQGFGKLTRRILKNATSTSMLINVDSRLSNITICITQTPIELIKKACLEMGSYLDLKRS